MAPVDELEGPHAVRFSSAYMLAVLVDQLAHTVCPPRDEVDALDVPRDARGDMPLRTDVLPTSREMVLFVTAYYPRLIAQLVNFCEKPAAAAPAVVCNYQYRWPLVITRDETVLRRAIRAQHIVGGGDVAKDDADWLAVADGLARGSDNYYGAVTSMDYAVNHAWCIHAQHMRRLALQWPLRVPPPAGMRAPPYTGVHTVTDAHGRVATVLPVSAAPWPEVRGADARTDGVRLFRYTYGGGRDADAMVLLVAAAPLDSGRVLYWTLLDDAAHAMHARIAAAPMLFTLVAHMHADMVPASAAVHAQYAAGGGQGGGGERGVMLPRVRLRGAVDQPWWRWLQPDVNGKRCELRYLRTNATLAFTESGLAANVPPQRRETTRVVTGTASVADTAAAAARGDTLPLFWRTAPVAHARAGMLYWIASSKLCYPEAHGFVGEREWEWHTPTGTVPLPPAATTDEPTVPLPPAATTD
jgi:hypothetical protein